MPRTHDATATLENTAKSSTANKAATSSMHHWMAMFIAAAGISACGGGGDDNNDAAVTDPPTNTTGDPVVTNPPTNQTPTGPTPGPVAGPTPGPATGPTPGPATGPTPGPGPAPVPGATPAPVAGSGAATDCLNTDIFTQASTIQWTFQVSQASSAGEPTQKAITQTEARYDTMPGVSTPFGTMTEMAGTGKVTNDDGSVIDVDLSYYLKLVGNQLEQYGFTVDLGGGPTNYSLQTVDPRYDLAVGESRDVAKTIFGNTVNVTYTYLGQETVSVPAGSGMACKFKVNDDTEWFAVGSGLPVKIVQSNDFTPDETLELITGAINGQPIQWQ